jgi:hypothetical protein
MTRGPSRRSWHAMRLTRWALANRRNHDLRYVLKDKVSGNVLFVVIFTLHLKEDVEKEEADAASGKAKDVGEKEAKPDVQPADDDLD